MDEDALDWLFDPADDCGEGEELDPYWFSGPVNEEGEVYGG